MSHDTTPMNIGFCGLGRMGVPMVRCLLRAGHHVSVWNRSPQPAQLLAAEGAVVCDSPRALAAACEQVALCLFDAAAVEAVVFGPDGLAQSRTLRTVIDHSSIPPDATRAFAQRLLQANGAQWLDAPVSGGTGGAAAGTLAIMVGGPQALCTELTPLLMAYAQRVTYMGPTGAGQVSKLCNQTIVATTITAIAEAVALAQDAGVQADRLSQALAGGWADSVLLQLFVPKMAQSADVPVQASLDTMLKDLSTVADLGRSQGTAMPVANAVAQNLQLASRQGLGARDISQLIRFYDREGPST